MIPGKGTRWPSWRSASWSAPRVGVQRLAQETRLEAGWMGAVSDCQCVSTQLCRRAAVFQPTDVAQRDPSINAHRQESIPTNRTFVPSRQRRHPLSCLQHRRSSGAQAEPTRSYCPEPNPMDETAIDVEPGSRHAPHYRAQRPAHCAPTGTAGLGARQAKREGGG